MFLYAKFWTMYVQYNIDSMDKTFLHENHWTLRLWSLQQPLGGSAIHGMLLPAHCAISGTGDVQPIAQRNCAVPCCQA